ncbi:type I-B CRISPR-associated protein Cas7/Csh2 [Nanoarchaeota archaeon]|nr:MAG: type I-B CRISPR-associated protein Cas7/Csh2 [Nanoarchaeota archaeon]
MVEVRNSEILLIYEAKLCNPNGDPDNENRPRIDPKTRINLVTDVRLKRFFRDYIVEKYGENFVYVTKIGGKSVRADSRTKRLLYGDENVPEINLDKAKEIPKRCIDARLFGAVVPIGKGEGKKGESISFIGPVQFTWGFSLHPVEIVESSTITSVFSGREEAERYGTIGKDWRLYYSLIAFYGVVSGRRAKQIDMTNDDLKILDNFLWKSLEVQPTTRSKIGEKPHLYLRVEYRDADTVLGDLRRFIKVEPKDAIRDLDDLKLDFTPLTNHLKKYSNRISCIYLNTSDELAYLHDQLKDIGVSIEPLPHELSEEEIYRILRSAEGT